MEYTSLSDYCKETFGTKLYKLTLDSGCTCPNRDGLLGTRGCLFCSAGGSGDFAAVIPGELDKTSSATQSFSDVTGDDLDSESKLDRQFEDAKARIRGKFKAEGPDEGRYIAYVQSFTGTYPGKDGFAKDATGTSAFDRMRERYLTIIRRPEVRVLSIATRPDCLGPEVLDMLKELRAIKPVWIELGLQTSNEETAEYIRRCYRNEVYEQAVRDMKTLDIPVITHVILGLPGETAEDMADTVRYAVGCGTWGIKLQLLHVLEGTDLGEQYKAQEAGMPLPGARPIRIMSLEEYTDLLCALLPLVPKDVVIHRLTGDGPKRILLAPLWSGDKKRVLNTISKAIRELPESTLPAEAGKQ
ncbi:MAG: TIGR01212 family radical SAM protein [Clostridia bacterium]|nr:TIGR01212 family radical SAM protein [Clostridia bacterium]